MTQPVTNIRSKDTVPMIELFGQHSWHSAGALRLNEDGAKSLIAALKLFLDEGRHTIEVYASDGEGYDLHLVSGDMHKDSKVNHYLDLPGQQADCADNLVYLLSKEEK
jgi:hypothetical protein